MRRLFLSALALICLTAVASAQQAAQLTLVDPPQVEGDRIELSVRVSGVDPRQVAALSDANFSVSEPFSDLSVVAEPRLPVSLGVLVNLSVNTELPLLQSTLRAYFDSYYREGDSVTFMLLTGRAPLVVSPANKAEIDALIESLTVSEIYFSVGDALTDLADLLVEARASAPDRAVMGLLVTAFINSAAEVASADSFAEAGIPLHVVQAHNFREGFTENLRQMAGRGGGIFVNNQAGALSTGESPVAVGALKVLYDAMDSSRLVFVVDYISRAIDLTLEPAVTLSLQLRSDESLLLPFSYRREFDPPVVEFNNPSISAVRRPSRLDGGVSFDIEGQDIAVLVRYPDSAPRTIQSLQLQVTDLNRNVVVQSELLVNPQVESDGTYRVRWTLDDYVVPGTNTPVSIAVSVTDELGLTGRAEQSASVTVAALPPLPTSTPLPPTATFTPQPPTSTPSPIPPTEAPTAVPTLAAQPLSLTGQNTLLGRELPIPVQDLTVALAIITTALVGIAAALLLRIRRMRRQLSTRVPMYSDSRMDMPTPLPSDEPAMAPVNEATGRVLGRLIVKRGLPAQEIPVKSTEFVIGRVAGDGIQYAIDAPFISPRHCVITFRNNRFLIRDLGSKNGTFVNGERILPERDTIVPNGSEVEITRQIVFELWDPDTVVRIDYQMDDARTERLNSRISTMAADSVSFPSALGIRAADDDDGEIGEDYSPV